jgi:hypothetical protein
VSGTRASNVCASIVSVIGSSTVRAIAAML